MTNAGLWIKRNERRNATVVLLLVLGTAMGDTIAAGECRSCQSHFTVCNNQGELLPGSGCRYCEKGFDLWSGYCFETSGGFRRLAGCGLNRGCGSTCESCGDGLCNGTSEYQIPNQAAPHEHSHAAPQKAEAAKVENETKSGLDETEKENAPEPANVDVPKVDDTAPAEPRANVDVPANDVDTAEEVREEVPAPKSEPISEQSSDEVPLPKNDVETNDEPAEEKIPLNPLDILPKNDVPASPPNSVKRPRRMRTVSRRTGSKNSTSRLLRHLQHVSESR